MNRFLPNVKVTTIVWADKNILKHSQWEAAQGDDLKNQRPTIELNLAKLAERGSNDDVAKSMVESWLSINIVFATRQELINKQVRGDVSAEAEETLCEANLKAVLQSPILRHRYADLAIDEILNGGWVIENDCKELANCVTAMLIAWREFSSQLDAYIDRCYLCKKQLVLPEASLRERLDFVTETPYAKIKPSPFIDTIVWVCRSCLPLAREMGLDVKPLEIKLKEVEDG